MRIKMKQNIEQLCMNTIITLSMGTIQSTHSGGGTGNKNFLSKG